MDVLDDVQRQIDLLAQAPLFSGGDAFGSRIFDPYWRQPFLVSAFKEAKGEAIIQGSG